MENFQGKRLTLDRHSVRVFDPEPFDTFLTLWCTALHVEKYCQY